MREWIGRVLVRVGIWCFQVSDRRVDYIDALQERERAARLRARAEADRRKAFIAFCDLLDCVKLVDGLLSSNHVEQAHQQLRVGIIASGGIASVRRPSRASSDPGSDR